MGKFSVFPWALGVKFWPMHMVFCVATLYQLVMDRNSSTPGPRNKIFAFTQFEDAECFNPEPFRVTQHFVVSGNSNQFQLNLSNNSIINNKLAPFLIQFHPLENHSPILRLYYLYCPKTSKHWIPKQEIFHEWRWAVVPPDCPRSVAPRSPGLPRAWPAPGRRRRRAARTEGRPAKAWLLGKGWWMILFLHLFTQWGDR